MAEGPTGRSHRPTLDLKGETIRDIADHVS